MFSRKSITNCTESNWANIERMKKWIASADAVVIGAGAGLSTSAGLLYGGERFQRLFPDFIEHYDLKDMYSSAFYPFQSVEEYWAYFSRHIYHNRYESKVNDCYKKLLDMVQEKNYFVITTNADHLFIKSGFDKEKLFYIQGDYGLFQCSVPCHQETYDNRDMIYNMVKQQKAFKVPSELLPKCPRCGKPMDVNLRKDGTFVEDTGWHRAKNRYEEFLQENLARKIVFLELGVGYNTPGIIKYPFWQMTYQHADARYICINKEQANCPQEIKPRTICLSDDICEILTTYVNGSSQFDTL